jgi:TRAP-type transport system small permease protein
MMNALNRANTILARGLEVVAALILLQMVVLVFGNVVGRYFFSRAITWADEMARYSFVWLTFIGTALGVQRGAHIGMDILTAHVSDRMRVALRIVSLLLILVFLVVWVRWGADLAQRNRRFIAPATGIPLSFVYGIAPAMAGVMTLQHLTMLIDAVRILLRRAS